MLELLAPAGSMEALRAAVQNGADAVYLGCGAFNARQSAKNFTPQTLVDAIKYCHVRGVQVHLTLNTLVSDREMTEAGELIRYAAQNNIDAFIVQDLGVVQLCRQIAPGVPIHGSTQMTVHSLPGVLLCAAMGMKRVVLSRELSREEIRYICANSPIEIEVFVHGALCMCYSGQCYMSAMIGGRSGNRGRCAQPCRQSYGYTHWQEKYPLSLKDNCLIPYLRELQEMGVVSLKLEGRMKRAEYVATVTAVYRKALDEIAALTKDVEEGRLHPKKATEALAYEIVARYHGEDQAQEALQGFNSVFADGGIPDDAPEFACEHGEASKPPVFLTDSGLAASRGEAKRLIKQGSLSLDGERCDDAETPLEPGSYVVKLGKKRFLRLTVR